nr:tetratricopeptide repeat protein [Nitrospirota bacterium]
MTGEYRMGDNDTRTDAKRLALQDAKRLALEKAGTYIESLTEVKNFAVSKDEVRAYTAGIVEVTEQQARSTMEGETTVVQVDVTCKIDTDIVTRQIDALRKNETAKTELLASRQEADRLRQENDALRQSLAAAKSKPEFETLAQKRREVLTDQDVNSLLAQAWVALAGSQKTLTMGSSSESGRTRARSLMEQALALDATEPKVHLLMGTLHTEEGNLDGAIAAYHTALRLKPDADGAHYNLGIVLSAKGDVDGAITEFRAVVRLNPNDAQAHYNLGTKLSDKGDVDGAITAYHVALRLKPDYASAHYNLGNVLSAKGDVDGAIAEYRTAVRLKPDHVNAHYKLGGALLAKGDLSGGIAALRAVLHLNPDDADAHYGLAAALKAQGRRTEAAGEFREYLRLAPDTPATRQWVEKAKAMLRELE